MRDNERLFEPNDVQNRSLIDKYLQARDRIWRFSSKIEDHYIAHTARIKLRPSLIGFGVCLLLFNLGVFWDNYVKPEILYFALAIRIIGVTIPCLCVGWLLFFWKNYRLHDWLLSASMLLIACAINSLALMREAPANHKAFLVSLLLIVCNIILQLRTLPAVFTSVGISAITTAFMWPVLTTTSPGYWQAVSYMYITAVITLLANTRLDSTMRRLYLMMLKDQIRHDEISRENEELSAFSYTDPLTGIANRRRMEQALRTAWTGAEANGSPLALLLIDIDHFKRFNDTYGHPAGDACLQLVARTIAGQVRHMTDLTARMGGEEFAVLMPGADENVAELIASRIHSALVNAQAGQTHSVTASIGIASCTPQEGSTIEELVSSADKALYMAKNGGRNQTVMAA
ncbi:GGDEF domain-containing protein [Rhizobium oryzicola]|uniref:diguanylate cyclase n=1 Tax=Rhizobium oryzicola TaxID=1232668 RepID=A0ABT8T2F2_9HYPH|nr:diguanylate cyclase [Rhizobium oryzicola]MDO1584361.1 diguanylate cyclase [Rhizobium oryzicola]